MSYIPAPNLDFDSWAENFVEQLEADPELYGFTAPEVAQLRVELDLWQAALALTENPSTRTTPRVEARKDQRVVLESLLRRFAQRVQSNFSTTNQMRADLQITIPAGASPPHEPTGIAPEIVAAASGQSLVISYQNPETPGSKAKPVGALGLEVSIQFQSNGDTPNPQQGISVGTITKTPSVLNLQGLGAAGQLGWAFGRWIYSGGQSGPWSAPASVAFAL